jgi:hypothetical protein
LLAIPLGVWILMRLPVGAQHRALGGEAATTTLAALAAVSLLWLIHQLARVALGDTRRGLLMRTVAMTVLLAVLMTGVSRRVQPRPCAAGDKAWDGRVPATRTNPDRFAVSVRCSGVQSSGGKARFGQAARERFRAAIQT